MQHGAAATPGTAPEHITQMHYVHIGMHKAGSTTVQKFLSDNVEVLRRHGLEYPDLGRDRNSHNRLVYSLQPRTNQAAEICQRLKEMATESGKKIVISAEGFEYVNRRQIRNLRDIFGSEPVKIIFHVRKFEELIPSKYTQRTKTGLNLSNIDDFVETALQQSWLQIANTIEKWVTHFTPASFAVSQLERLEKRDDALVRQMWRDIDLSDDDYDGQAIIPDAKSNPSPHWIAVEFVRAINQELNRHPIDESKLADSKRIKTKRIIQGDETATAFHINGLLPVLQNAATKCDLESRRVGYLRQSDRSRIREFYNEEIARLNSLIGTDLRPAEETPSAEREGLPSVDLLSADERRTVWRAIKRTPKVVNLPEVVRERIEAAVKGPSA